MPDTRSDTDRPRRNTYQRQMVLDAIMQRTDHPTADDIFVDVHNRDPHISRATVYRNLHLLVEDKTISSVRIGRGERYDYRTDQHMHLVCERCGAIIDASAPEAFSQLEQVAKDYGFEPYSRQIIYRGLCANCLSREEQDT